MATPSNWVNFVLLWSGIFPFTISFCFYSHGEGADEEFASEAIGKICTKVWWPQVHWNFGHGAQVTPRSRRDCCGAAGWSCRDCKVLWQDSEKKHLMLILGIFFYRRLAFVYDLWLMEAFFFPLIQIFLKTWNFSLILVILLKNFRFFIALVYNFSWAGKTYRLCYLSIYAKIHSVGRKRNANQEGT